MFDFLSQKISTIFSNLVRSKNLNENNIEDVLRKVSDALIESDVPYDVVQEFINQIKTEVVGKQIPKKLNPAEYFTKLFHDKLVGFLSGQKDELENFSYKNSGIILVMGLQGSGKTTTVGKLSQYLIDQANTNTAGKKIRIMIASVDYYRPAAIDQLEILSQKINRYQSEVLFYRAKSTDPVQASQEIHNYFKNLNFDFLFLDTAGRLHIDNSMLQELKNINEIVKPQYKFLVLDSMTGQESLNVAKSFNEIVPFSGAILTKMDSEARAGASFAFRYVLKKPILFVGSGEKLSDLEQFKPERVASRIIGMGDLQSFIEKAQTKIKESESDQLLKSLTQGKFTLNDFAAQIDMVSRFGSLSSLMKYMPMGGMKVSDSDLAKGEAEIKKFKAVISSMTPKERLNPGILNNSRKQRVANGAGLKVVDVDFLLKRFEQTQQFAKIFSRMGHLKGPFNK
ncbi:signal recognition particle protein Srp54 [Candidatus Dependentiae bacterium]|nr:signal recognition particle protein Srp54 [Candidatus Dependentiae bacterium]